MCVSLVKGEAQCLLHRTRRVNLDQAQHGKREKQKGEELHILDKDHCRSLAFRVGYAHSSVARIDIQEIMLWQLRDDTANHRCINSPDVA